jgi:hypothetical protein
MTDHDMWYVMKYVYKEIYIAKIMAWKLFKDIEEYSTSWLSEKKVIHSHAPHNMVLVNDE